MLPHYIVVAPLALRSMEAADIDTDYTNFGDPMEDSVIMLRVVNTTDQDIIISWFNEQDHMIVPTGQSAPVYNFAANQGTAGSLMTKSGIQFQCKSADATPTSGSIYLEAYHGVPN